MDVPKRFSFEFVLGQMALDLRLVLVDTTDSFLPRADAPNWGIGIGSQSQITGGFPEFNSEGRLLVKVLVATKLF